MVRIQIDQPGCGLDEILRYVESGELVQLLRGGRVVALVRGADDLAGWSAASLKQLSSILPQEDFSDWDPPDAAR